MKLLVRSLLLLFALTFSVSAFAQVSTTSKKAPKAKTHKKTKAVDPAAVTTPAGNRNGGATITPNAATAPKVDPNPSNGGGNGGATITPNAVTAPKADPNPSNGGGNGGATITPNAVTAPKADPNPSNGGGKLTPVPVSPPKTDANPANTSPDGVTNVDPSTGLPVVEKLTTISIAESNFDFGKIKEGDVVKHKFKFTNTGTNDLILDNVKPSCGCTALDWPHDPIAPGKSGEIEAQFNSTGKSGAQMKTITLTLNSTERLERITFTGEVIPKPIEAGAADVATPATGH